MIVSSREIHNVLDLVHSSSYETCATHDAAPPAIDLAAGPVATHPAGRPLHSDPLPLLPGQDRRWRHVRVHDLRRQLADGRYSVVPDIVADKIIGRALCDQVSRLYER